MLKNGSLGIGSMVFLISILAIGMGAVSTLFISVNSMQQDSSASMDETTTSLNSYVIILKITGFVTTNSIHSIKIVAEAGANTDPIFLEKSFFSLKTANGTVRYMFGQNQTLNNAAGTYVVDAIHQGTQYREGYISQGDIVEFSFTTTNISSHEFVDIQFLPYEGVPTTVSFTTPRVFGTKTLHLFP